MKGTSESQCSPQHLVGKRKTRQRRPSAELRFPAHLRPDGWKFTFILLACLKKESTETLVSSSHRQINTSCRLAEKLKLKLKLKRQSIIPRKLQAPLSVVSEALKEELKIDKGRAHLKPMQDECYLEQERYMAGLGDFLKNMDAFSLQALYVILVTGLEELNRL